MSEHGQPQNVTVTIDGLRVEVPKGTLLVEAAKQITQEIPVYCYHTKLGPAGLCRVCLVEIEGMPKLQIACNTPVTDGMVVHTYNDKVDEGRRSVLELLLVNHPLDCPICDKGGECDLQDFSMAYGQGASKLVDPKTSKPKAVDLGPTIVLDEERCIVCQRCVRFDEIITREQSLVVKDRGVRDIIATATDQPYRSNFSGNVTEICPVGALTSKTYRFKSRPWDLHRTQTSCTQCAVGCQQFIDERFDNVLRTMSVEHDDAISDGWLCDRGRYNIGFYKDARRLNQPLYKQDGQWIQIGWDDAIGLWAGAIKDAIAKTGAQSVGVLGGGRLLNEEAFLLADVFGKLGVKNLDWRAGRQRQAHPGKDGGSLVDLENAQAIVIAGQMPGELAPVLDLRIRKAVSRNKAVLIAIDNADCLPPIPFVNVADVRAAVAAIPHGTQHVAIVWDGIDDALARELVAAIPSDAKLLTYIANEQANARGAEMLGMRPGTDGLDLAGMLQAGLDGKLAVLSIFGANPALHFADGNLVRESLAKIPFIVVSELFMTQTAEYANLILPAQGSFEKTGTTTNLAGDVLPINAGLKAAGGTMSDYDIVCGLARELKVQLASREEVEQLVIERLAHDAPAFTLGEVTICGPSTTSSPSPNSAQDDKASAGPAYDDKSSGREADAQSKRGLQVVVQSRIFAGGGTIAHDSTLEQLRPLPEAAFSLDDAKTLGIAGDDYVDLEGEHGTLHDLLVELRPGMRSGSVAIIGGLPDDAANQLGANARVEVTNIRSSVQFTVSAVGATV
ncbi:MAG: molybdopterin-dependent oxidoreductase [Candidatus Eremiobacteraeota bacterium]|nr:molybdopterin-dependent oxidoreductase [Candidatus Eremiobacteraeota bacterium]